MRKLAVIVAALPLLLFATPSVANATEAQGSLNFAHPKIVTPNVDAQLKRSLKNINRQKRAHKKGLAPQYAIADARICHQHILDLKADGDFLTYSIAASNCRVRVRAYGEAYTPQSEYYIDSWNKLPLPQDLAGGPVANTSAEIREMVDGLDLTPEREQFINNSLRSQELKQARLSANGSVKLVFLRDWGSELWVEDAVTGATLGFVDSRCFSEPPANFQAQIAGMLR